MNCEAMLRATCGEILVALCRANHDCKFDDDDNDEDDDDDALGDGDAADDDGNDADDDDDDNDNHSEYSGGRDLSHHPCGRFSF